MTQSEEATPIVWQRRGREDGDGGITPEETIPEAKDCGIFMDATPLVKRINKRAARPLLLCGVLAPLVLGVSVIAAGLVTPDFSFLSESISQLGARGKAHPEVMNAGLILCGLLIAGFAYGLYWRLGRSGVAKTVWLLLAIDGMGVVLSGIFQADSKSLGLASTLEGYLHSIFAQVAFFALLISILMFATVVHRKPAWRGFTRMSLAVFVFNLVLLLVFLTGGAEPVDGLLVLSFFGVSLVWLEAVSLRSLLLPATAGLQQVSP